MVLRVARSRDEAHLYLDLHPCDWCGSVDTDWDSALTGDGGVPARRYHGTCGGCGQAREFVFRAPERPAAPPPDEIVFFGGSEPSRLFDAGQWRTIADVGVQEGSAPSTGDRAGDLERRQAFAVAVAALSEVLKFIPDGADAVPESAFWTEYGRAVREQHPEHFTRADLERTRHSYRSEMAELFRHL